MAQSNPAMMQQAMAQMGNMSAGDWSQATEQMSRMSAEDITRNTAQMNQQASARQKCELHGAFMNGQMNGTVCMTWSLPGDNRLASLKDNQMSCFIPFRCSKRIPAVEERG